MLTTVGMVEQKPVDSADLQYLQDHAARLAHDEPGAGSRGRTRGVHETTDPGRVEERELLEVDRDLDRLGADDVPEQQAQRLRARKVELAPERDYDLPGRPAS